MSKTIILAEFGHALRLLHEVQNGKLIAVNMNPENCTPNVLVENPEKVLLYVWVKTDLAPNIPVYVPNETHDFITKLSKQ